MQKLWYAVALLGWATAFAQTPPPAAAPAPSNSKAAASNSMAAPAAPEGYAGSEACRVCHADILTKFSHTPHAAAVGSAARNLRLSRTATNLAGGITCEACHGPGAKHAESASAADIVNPSKLHPEQTDQICLVCHRQQHVRTGVIERGHPGGTTGCTGCHVVHETHGGKLVVRQAAAINAQCAECHTSVWASFQKPYKHRLPEGAMSCTSCHNPHAALTSQTQRVSFSNESGCFRCHGNLRGPFTYEHAPVRLEGCISCHEPHGSANPRMLTRHEVRLVCLECHANLPGAVPTTSARTIGNVPPAFHDLRSPRFQNCTICHRTIHGSYADRSLLR